MAPPGDANFARNDLTPDMNNTPPDRPPRDANFARNDLTPDMNNTPPDRPPRDANFARNDVDPNTNQGLFTHIKGIIKGLFGR